VGFHRADDGGGHARPPAGLQTWSVGRINSSLTLTC
jgi:hypothetical protein